MDDAFRRIRIGDIECLVLSDGRYEYPATALFGNVEPRELTAALASHGISGQRIETPYACMLIEGAGRRILVDTGGAGWDPSVGRLARSLAAAGVDPVDVDLVVLTHGHPDHIGGTVDDQGRPVFRRALHVMAAAEWDHWTSDVAFVGLPDAFRRIAAHNLAPIAGGLWLTEGEIELAPGVTLLPAPGHTPGHLAVVVADRGEELLYVSDAIIHPIQLEHVTWGPKYDIDARQAADTRRMLCRRAVARDSLVHGFHFDPFPCLGRIHEAGGAWRWEPLATGAAA